ncbi:D-beta-hydroxybutyrate permease, partial [Pseudomonas sp. FEN]
ECDHRPCGAGVTDAGRLPWLQRHPVCPHRRPRRRPAHRPVRRRSRLHRSVHGENGRLRQTLLPGIPARRRVRQADRAVRVLARHRRRRHPPVRHPSGDAGDRAGLRLAHLRWRLAVRGGVRGLPVCRRDVSPERYPQAPDPGHHCPRRVLLHHGRPARHAADPEHHSQHLLQYHRLGRALAGADRYALRVLRRHAVPATPAQPRPARGRRLRHGTAQRTGNRRGYPAAQPLGRPLAAVAGRHHEPAVHPLDPTLVRQDPHPQPGGHEHAGTDRYRQAHRHLGGAGRAAGGHHHGLVVRLPGHSRQTRRRQQERGRRCPAGGDEHRLGIRLRRGHRLAAGFPGAGRLAQEHSQSAGQRGHHRHPVGRDHRFRLGRHEHRPGGDGRQLHQRRACREYPAGSPAPGRGHGQRRHGHPAPQRRGDHPAGRHRADPPGSLQGYFLHYPDQDPGGLRGDCNVLCHWHRV